MCPLFACFLMSLLPLHAEQPEAEAAARPGTIRVEVLIVEINCTKAEAAPDELKKIFPQSDQPLVFGTPQIFFGANLDAQGRTDLLAKFQKLRDLGMAQLIGAPSIVTRSGQEAVLQIGTKVGLMKTYQVLARLLENDRIDLDVEIDYCRTDADGGRERWLQRQTCSLDSGHSFLMWGSGETRSIPMETRTPVLGSLPLIGHWFTSTKHGEEVAIERWILITAILVDEAEAEPVR
ncbi:MAG: hypothetical protein AB7K24_29010 [Gemmataceae bacterium]